jgi:threonyl-tRNA synthetase
LEYVAQDGTRKRPVMIHRAPFGSLERLIGILIEEYVGDFPLWLAPVQVRIVQVSEMHLPYAKEVVQKMRSLGIRAEVDTSGERLPKQIRNGEQEKIPVMAVVGDKEVESHSLSIRVRGAGGKSQELGAIPVTEVIERMKNAITNYKNFDSTATINGK